MSGPKLAGGLAIVAVVAAIVAGLVISGSPEQQRLLRLDQQRVNDLMNLSFSVDMYFRETDRIPDALQDLVDGRRMSVLPRDPVSEAEYGYERLESRVYQLCAEFALPSANPQFDEFWAHEAGRQCFRFDFLARLP